MFRRSNSTGKPKVSIVFPTFNRPREAELTARLLRKNLSLPFETIILDNSPEPVDFDPEPGGRLVWTGANLGAAARNIGVELACGEYILMLDDDSHPLPGAVERAAAILDGSGDEVAGLAARVVRLDGGAENTPLLPTVFHGCGVLFRASAAKSMAGALYPGDFIFYGEEYWTSLALYRGGGRLAYSNGFTVCHRLAASGRDKSRILQHLTVNNRRTYPPFVPSEFLQTALADTLRRYELIAAKEGISEAFLRGLDEELPAIKPRPMKREDFLRFSLLSEFAALIDEGVLDTALPIVLCGAGKFPGLWVNFLAEAGCREVGLADFNPGLIGHQHGGRVLASPVAVVEGVAAKPETQHIIGHSSRVDSQRWRMLVRRHGGKIVELDRGFRAKTKVM